jgi:ribosome-associated protein
MNEFRLNGEYIELHKLLKVLGAAESGGGAKALVAEGRVRVDGQVELRKGCKVRSGQTVEFPGSRVRVVS